MLFERDARRYLEQTLKLARSIRPRALWGYYHYPYCKAYIPHVESCAPPISEDNNKWVERVVVRRQQAVRFDDTGMDSL